MSSQHNPWFGAMLVAELSGVILSLVGGGGPLT
jgi:hypothetical protein